MRRTSLWIALGLAAVLASCGGGGGGGDDDGGGDVPAADRQVVVFAWNDLGMHCLNPTYDKDVILPPYNNLWAQVVRRSGAPEIVTSGVTVHYEIVNNTSSYGKAGFGGFWDRWAEIFPGVPVQAHDVGLTGNGLSGTMTLVGDHYEATGVPVVPIDDDGVRSPYQVAKITVKDLQGAVLAETRCTVPTSDEFNCKKCHRSAASPAAPFEAYLALHDAEQGTSLAASTTAFLCADPSRLCHVSPALGQALSGGRTYLSQVIHSFHGGLDAAERPVCYDCHPGGVALCNRSLRHTGADGNCTACHGSLAEVGDSIARGDRVPWLAERSTCATCHGGATIPEVDTGSTLYRHAAGHQGIRCPACHGSPHAMYPADEARDPTANYQPEQYLGAGRKVVSIGSCGACHGSSRGEGLGEFGEAHGGASPEARNGCHVCHTQVAATPTQWPHQYKWNAR